MNNKQPTVKKVANNILEFLIDPTVYPPERHIYFRPEEILDNSSYENAKKDSERAYGDQRQNSDFYPNRPIREASLMERKTLIASLDVLSQNFNESDPMAKDLRTMAYAISKMSDDELRNRLIMDVEAKKKPEMVKCPQCGGNVMKKTGYCVKCGKKISEMKKAADEKEAGREKGLGVPDGTGPMKDDPKCPLNKKAEDYWNKEATEAVRRSLIAEVLDACDDKDKMKKDKEVEAKGKKAPKEDETPAPKEDETPAPKEDETPAPKKEKAPEEVSEEEEVAVEVDPSAKQANAEPQTEEKEATEVDTSLLTATSMFDGIEMQAGLVTTEDTGDLSASEKARLDLLFQ